MSENKKDDKKPKLTEEEKIELRHIITGEIPPLEQKASIVYDGKQYTVRIPVKIAEAVGIDPKKDKIKFIAIPPKVLGEPSELDMELVKE